LRIFGHRTSDVGLRISLLGTALAVLALGAACGKKGPPLAPLVLAPEAPKKVTARRLGDTVYLQMTVPDHSATGRGGFSVDHLDVYAVTVPPGAPFPANRDVIKPEYIVGQISVQPPLDPDAPAPDPPDPRPLPGASVTFVEKITEADLVPTVLHIKEPAVKTPKQRTNKGETGAASSSLPPTSPSSAPPPPPGAQVLTRIYFVQGVPKGGKGTTPSPRLDVPLLQAPGVPRPGAPTSDETSVTVMWEPPPSTTDESPGVSYNVYVASGAADAGAKPVAPTPLNDKPLTEEKFTHAGADAGKEQCFVVRSVATVGSAAIESNPSAPVCITPKDTYPPAAPKGLAAVASEGVVNLIWDANTEPDLAGYVVLRGEAPGATLQPLMTDPIKETRYADRTARPGMRYVYQIQAVDKAGNRSGLSNRVEEAAR
jgi:hypothetical protein